MSRRHKNNVEEQSKPQQQAEPQGDGSPRGMRFSVSSTVLSKKLSSLIRVVKEKPPCIDNLAEEVCTAVFKALRSKDVEVDANWLKIPSKYLDSRAFSLLHEMGHCAMDEEPSAKKSKKGRPWLKRLIDKVEDSKVVSWFKTTLADAKQKAKEFYQDVTQFAVCFLKGIHEAFCPDDDPSGKLSHYHRMLVDPVAGITDIPSRETLSRHYRWFRDWRQAVTFEDCKAKREKRKHRIWERLIQWIKDFLLKLAPKYAAQPVCEVGI